MFSPHQIEIFQQHLIDLEAESKRQGIKSEILAAMDNEKISRTNLGQMISVLHSLISATECSLVEIMDAVSELVPAGKNRNDLKAEQLVELFTYDNWVSDKESEANQPKPVF